MHRETRPYSSAGANYVRNVCLYFPRILKNLKKKQFLRALDILQSNLLRSPVHHSPTHQKLKPSYRADQHTDRTQHTMQPEEDSDEEWARIADAVGEFEAQYIANGNTLSNTTTTAPPPPPPTSQLTTTHPPLPPPSHPQTTKTPSPLPPQRPYTDTDVDPYALALRQRDTELAQVRTEHEGEVANYRNKVRALQNQLLEARNAGSSRDVGEGRVGQLEQEKERLDQEVQALSREMRRMGERVAFAEHEVKEAREKERRYLMEGSGGGVGGGRGEGEVVEGTQFIGGTQFVGGTQLAAGAEVTGGTQTTNAAGVVGSQGFKMGGRNGNVRLPVKRRRRVSSAGGRLERRAEEEKGDEKGEGGKKRGVEEMVKQSGGSGGGGEGGLHDVQHGWGVRLGEGHWEYGRLRREIFGRGVGSRLMEMATRFKEEGLNAGILGAMSGDGGWQGLMEEVGKLQNAGRGAQLVSVECLCAMLRYCGECRRRVGSGESKILEITRKTLERATRHRDGELAGGCIRVLISGGCGIGEVGGGCERSRKMICCEAALEWIGGEDMEIVREAIELVEVVSGLAMEEEIEGEVEGWRGEEWGFVERGYVKVCQVVREGKADDGCVRIVMGMLMRGIVRAPYVVVESGGGEVAADLFIWGVEKEQVEFVAGCGKVVCGAIEEGGVSGGTRRVLLGVVWGGMRMKGGIARECRLVAMALERSESELT